MDQRFDLGVVKQYQSDFFELVLNLFDANFERILHIAFESLLLALQQLTHAPVMCSNKKWM